MHKLPEMFTMFDNSAAFAGQFVFSECSFFKKLLYMPHQWYHSIFAFSKEFSTSCAGYGPSKGYPSLSTS